MSSVETVSARQGGESSAPTDEALIAQIVRGDRAAIAALYDRYAPLLTALGDRVLRDSKEAEDLLHDVFLEVWRHAGDYDATRGSVRSWLCMRMRSRALDRVRSAGRSRSVPMEDAGVTEVESMVDEDPTLAPDRMIIRRALTNLPPEQREVLELGYFEGLSSSEIAERAGIPIGTVKSRVAAAMTKLRAQLRVGSAT